MARSHAQPIRGALDFLELRHVFDAPENFLSSWMSTKRATDVLRDALETRSDFGFVADIQTELDARLTDLGIQPTGSAALLAELLTRPGFSAAKQREGLTFIRHGVLFARDEERNLGLEVLVDLQVTVQPWHADGAGTRTPASVTEWVLTCHLFDMVDDTDLGAALATHAELLREFPAPRAAARASTATIAVLGDPKELGTDGVPDNWRARLEVLAHSFDLAVSFHQHPVYTGTLADRVRRVIRFEPFTGVDPTTFAGDTIPHIGVDARTLTWEELFRQVAVAVADTSEPAAKDNYAPRNLRAGERIYHRKRGNSRAFDSFDVGSTSPCIHKTFIVWPKSPKAAAGMLRRYPNFQTSWLRHCSRGMNCGMYAVFAPESL